MKRPDGATQLTFGGHPLYTYILDTQPGVITGQAIDQDGGPGTSSTRPATRSLRPSPSTPERRCRAGGPVATMRRVPSFHWRGAFTDAEVNRLHAEAFGGPENPSPWNDIVARHSLGWVVGRGGGTLVGFANVVTDGLVHAWLQDVMVAQRIRGQGIGSRWWPGPVTGPNAGCRWLHVDYEGDLANFTRRGAGSGRPGPGCSNWANWRGWAGSAVPTVPLIS